MTSVISPVFQRMLSASQIENTVTAALKKWFPTYLKELEHQLDLEPLTFEIPKNYSDRNSFDAEAGETTPKIVVISPGIVGSPEKRGNGQYSAIWRLGVGVAVSASTEDSANLLVKGYSAAVRAIMLQNSNLNSIGAFDILWTDESYDDLPIINQIQLLKAASLFFNIYVADTVTRKPGPTEPDSPPYDYGAVETADVILIKEPIT